MDTGQAHEESAGGKVDFGDCTGPERAAGCLDGEKTVPVWVYPGGE